MAGVVPIIPLMKFTDAAGEPVALGWVTVYLAGTVTLATTYQDAALTVPNTNPKQLDAGGGATFWVDPSKRYKILLQDSAFVTVPGWPVDNVPGGAIGDPSVALAAANGAAMVGFLQAGPGGFQRDLQAKSRDIVSAKDFGAIADGGSHPLSSRYATLAAAQAVYPWVTALTQEIDTTAVDAAARYLASLNGGDLVIPPGTGNWIWKRPTIGSQRGVFLASNIRVRAYGATLQMLDNCDFFTAFPATVEKLTVSADVALNDVALTVDSAGTLATGDKVFVRLNTSAYDAAEPGNWYWASVVSVVGLVVTLDRPAPAAMSVAATTAGNRQIVKPSDVSNVTVEGASFISSVGGSVEGCINAQYVHSLTLRNLKGADCGAGLGIVQYTENVKLERLYADGIRAETGSKGRLLSLAECDGVDADTITVKNFAAASAAIVVEASCVNVNFRNVLAGCDGTGGSGGRRYVFSSLGQGPFMVDGLTIRGKNIYPSTGALFLGQPRMRNVHIWAQYTLAGGAGPVLDDMMLGTLQYTRRTVSVRIAIPTTASNKVVDLPSGRVIRSRILATSLTGLTGVFLRRDATGLNNGVSLVPAAANVAAENNFDYVDTGANNRNFNDDKQILLTAGGTTPAGNFVYMQLEMLMRDGLNEDAGTSMLTYIDA